MIIALLFGGVVGCKSFNRSQARADARNQVAITHIKIQQAIATSGSNNSIIYVPSGPNGVPIVQTAPVPIHKP